MTKDTKKKRRPRASLPPLPTFERIVGLKTTTTEELILRNSGFELSDLNSLSNEIKKIQRQRNIEAAEKLFAGAGEWLFKETALVEIDAISVDLDYNRIVKKRGQAREISLNPDFVQKQAKERTREANAWIKHSQINPSKLYFITMNINETRVPWGFEYKRENSRRWEKLSLYVKLLAEELKVFVQSASLEQTFADEDLSIYPHFHMIAYIPEPIASIGKIRDIMCEKWREVIGNDRAYLHLSGNVKSSTKASMYILKPTDLTAMAKHEEGQACFNWLLEGMKKARNYAKYNHLRDFAARLRIEKITTCGSVVEPELRKKQADEYHSRKPKNNCLGAAPPITESQENSSDPAKVEEVKPLPKGKNTIVATIPPRPIVKHCVPALMVNNYDPSSKGDESQRKLADIQMKLDQQRDAFVKRIGGVKNLKYVMAKRDAMRELASLFIEKGITPPKTEQEWLASEYYDFYMLMVDVLSDHYKNFYEQEDTENAESTQNYQNSVDDNLKKTPPQNDFSEGMIDFLSIFD